MSNNRAFTLVEFIFILVVIGILAAILTPSSRGSRLREAADQVASHIRYTQHLAMIDDRFDPNNSEWFKERWQIQFMDVTVVKGDTKRYWSYVIYSDTSAGHSGDPQWYEIARNPMDLSKRLTGGTSAIAAGDLEATPQMNLGKEYGIVDVAFSSACSNGVPPKNSKRLAFDYVGRPLKGDISTLKGPYDTTHMMYKRCNIMLTDNSGKSINITIEPETGFVQVVPF